MSYTTIKKYMVKRMKSLKYAEATDKFNFNEISDADFGKTFIVGSPSGQLAAGDMLGATFYPKKLMSVKLAFSLAKNAVYDYDRMQEAVDFIIKDLHNPVNFIADSIKNFQYQSHTVTEQPKGYVVVEILFEATDSVAY